MPIKGILNSAHALSYYTRWQEVTANNLANASTDGFKLERLTGSLNAGTAFPSPVEKLDLQQGPIRHTGRDLNVALEGQGFLVVDTPQGQRLSRGGSLHVDVSGKLVDGDGNSVQGDAGPIVIPDGAKIDIQGDGTILLDGAPLDKLRIETVADPNTLQQESGGRLSTSAPLIPAAPGTVTLQQGAVEDPNGDSVVGMVDLVTIQRAYAANVDALKAMDGVLDTVAGQIGSTQS